MLSPSRYVTTMSAKAVRGLPRAGHRDGLRLTTASRPGSSLRYNSRRSPDRNGGSKLTLAGRSFGIEGA